MSKESAVEVEVSVEENQQNDEVNIESLTETEQAAPAPLYVKHSVFKPSFHQKKKTINTSDSMLFENPFDARSPQEVLESYGIRRRDDSMFPNNTNLPQYGDFSEFRELGDRVNIYLSCKEQFESLPSEVRKEFDNDLSKFTKYVNSKDFDITRVMSKDYRENVYEPQLRKQKRDKAYADYLRKKQDEEMNSAMPPIS